MARVYSIEELIAKIEAINDRLDTAMSYTEAAISRRDHGSQIGVPAEAILEDLEESFSHIATMVNEASSELSDLNFVHQAEVDIASTYSLIQLDTSGAFSRHGYSANPYFLQLIPFDIAGSDVGSPFHTQALGKIHAFTQNPWLPKRLGEMIGFESFRSGDIVEVITNEVTSTGNTLSGLYQIYMKGVHSGPTEAFAYIEFTNIKTSAIEKELQGLYTNDLKMVLKER